MCLSGKWFCPLVDDLLTKDHDLPQEVLWENSCLWDYSPSLVNRGPGLSVLPKQPVLWIELREAWAKVRLLKVLIRSVMDHIWDRHFMQFWFHLSAKNLHALAWANPRSTCSSDSNGPLLLVEEAPFVRNWLACRLWRICFCIWQFSLVTRISHIAYIVDGFGRCWRHLCRLVSNHGLCWCTFWGESYCIVGCGLLIPAHSSVWA